VVGPATYYPTARGRHNERLRPALSELLPLADQIRALSPFDHHVWANLAAHTEAAWARRALAGDWPSWTRQAGQVLELVCRPNLDLHTGTAGWYRQRHGNLRTDGPQATLTGALEQGGRSLEALWFGPDPLPSTAELAARHRDPDGQGVHFSADSVRSLWLDRAQPARRTTSQTGSVADPGRWPGRGV
jgi:hypothetical protein